MTELSSGAAVLAILVGASSLAYVAACLLVTWQWRRRSGEAMQPWPAGGEQPSVTVLKPLCGLEPNLEQNLRSFCEQAYPTMEILFGARHPHDPALSVARRIAAEYPDRDIQVLVGGYMDGANQKVATLAHLVAHARHDIVVIADSDIRVGPEYLRTIVTPLADPVVGVVTCLYRGAPTGTLWSRLAALAIDDWFAPSVLLGRALGFDMYCSGATMALRREVLTLIGGFDAITHVLADDYEIGRRVRDLGLRVELSQYEVETTVVEPSLIEFLTHELRWARTIRAVEPAGNAFLFLTYSLPMTLLAALTWHQHPWVLVLPAIAVLLRVPLHALRARAVRPDDSHPEPHAAPDRASLWWVPARDLLSFAVWSASFTTHRVVWRRNALHLRRDGVLRTQEGSPA